MVPIEKRSSDAEKFLTEFIQTITIADFEKIYIGDYTSLEKEVDDCLRQLRHCIGSFYEQQELSIENRGNLQLKNGYQDARYNLEAALVKTERLWNKIYQSKLIESFDSLKEHVIANEVKIQEDEQKPTFLKKLEDIRKELELPLKIGEMATKYSKYLGPGFAYLLSKLI